VSGNQWASRAVDKHGTARLYQPHITSSFGTVRAWTNGVPSRLALPVGVVGASAPCPTQRNALRRIRRRVEPPAPTDVVLPACGRSPALAPEGDPPRFLIAGNPRPLEAAFLVEGHDVTHGRGVYTR
jgi:hypothetical protein